MNSKKNIGIITSAGGHYFQIKQLLPYFKGNNIFWIINPKLKYEPKLHGSTVYIAYAPESRNVITALANALQSFSIFRNEKPDVLISCGAGIAVPFFFIGKFFYHTKLIFIEPIDFVAYPSLTGKIVYNFVDYFFVQQKIQKTWYPKAVYQGSIL